MKKVRAVDEIVFESDPSATIAKGTIYDIDEVGTTHIILAEENTKERILIDLDTFENGFEIAVAE